MSNNDFAFKKCFCNFDNQSTCWQNSPALRISDCVLTVNKPRISDKNEFNQMTLLSRLFDRLFKNLPSRECQPNDTNSCKALHCLLRWGGKSPRRRCSASCHSRVCESVSGIYCMKSRLVARTCLQHTLQFTHQLHGNSSNFIDPIELNRPPSMKFIVLNENCWQKPSVFPGTVVGTSESF